MKAFLLITGIISSANIFSQSNTSSFEECNRVFKTGFSSPEKFVENSANFRKCLEGKKFPDFKSISIRWNAYSNEDLKGKVVLINFWFISCAPCVAEMPMLKELKNEYRAKDFFLLTFARDDKKSIEEFFKEHSVEIETIPDANKLIEEDFKWRLGFPANFIIGKDGIIADCKTGGPTDEAGIAKVKQDLKKIIETKLKE